MDESANNINHVSQEPLENDVPNPEKPKVNSSVNTPRRQEEPVEFPVQIKHEPELILEPDELPYPAVTVEEMTPNDSESSAEEFRKKRDVTQPKYIDPNKCYICNKVFETNKDVQIHLLKHGDMIPYQCSSCTMETGEELRITSLNLRHKHFRKHDSAIKCPEYPHRTQTDWGMQTHIQAYHVQNSQAEHICEHCGKKFQNKRSWHTHVLTHKALDEEWFPCSYCNKKFPCKRALIRHKLIHTGEKAYQCYVCDKSFRIKRYLNEHISIVHMKSHGTILTCKFKGCDYSTTNFRTLKAHKAKHELRFQCSQCWKRFRTGSMLRRHQYVHTGGNNFSCDQCDKSLKSKQRLQEHVARHNNPYICDMCGMDFVSKRVLKQHMLNHSAQLSFECRRCGMKYRYRANRTRHEKRCKETALKLVDFDTDVTEKTNAMKTETTDTESMLPDHINQTETVQKAAPKPIPSVTIAHSQEDKIELPVEIKHEPELILEPEELPIVAEC